MQPRPSTRPGLSLTAHLWPALPMTTACRRVITSITYPSQARPLWPLISGGFATLTEGRPYGDVSFTTCPRSELRQRLHGHVPTGHNMSFANFPKSGSVTSVGSSCSPGWSPLYGRPVAVTGWEPFAVVFVALVPVVWEPVLVDLPSTRLGVLRACLIGSAFALRASSGRGRACSSASPSSQAVRPVGPRSAFRPCSGKSRWRLLISSAAAVVPSSALSFIVSTSGRAFRSVVLGTGDTLDLRRHDPLGVRHSRGAPDLRSRVLPILVGMGIAWWAQRRLGPRVLEPLPMVSLLATCLSLRLVFEEGLFGYKFMALAVMLVLVAVVRGQIRGGLVAWLVLASLMFVPIPTTGTHQRTAIGRPRGRRSSVGVYSDRSRAPLVHGLIQGRVRWYLIAWLVVAACAFLQWPLWSFDSNRARLPLWLLQLILLPTGVACRQSVPLRA